VSTTRFQLGPALLFYPADRPDRYAKALERSDAVILDLEDATAPERRATARNALAGNPLDPERTIVRVNPSGTEDFRADLVSLRETAYRYVMLPKADSSADLDSLRGYSVIALCETAAGIVSAGSLASAGHVSALMWGSEDLIASMGGMASRHEDGRYRDLVLHARSSVALAAAAHGVGMIDAVHLDIADQSGLAYEARDAAALGFAATACIHPSQVETVRAAYRPAEREVARAQGVLNAAGAAGVGVIRLGDQMIDAPGLEHARSVLRRAGKPVSDT
jgi:citrate lyase subunit beta / citryl-CoA lyase